jgi:hypothetical protein
MKTAIYIEDGVMQLVITPESEFERGAFKTFEGKPIGAQLFAGSFYDCRGGWVRQKHYSGFGHNDDNDERSLIIRTTQEPA